MSKTVDMTPTWETAVGIYMMVLENPEASEASKSDARADLIKLARFVDAHQQEAVSNG
jgi:hypothetical protein